MHPQTRETSYPQPVAETIRALLIQARRALMRDPAGAERFIEGAVHLLPEMHPAQAERDVAPNCAVGGLAPWQMLRVRTLIEAQLAERLSVRDLAAVTRLSSSHFARSFKRSFGDSPQVYINRRRIVRAKALMMQTDESLTGIAMACGLADQAHFCRLFRRFEGQSPSGWRRANDRGGEMLLTA